MSAPVSRHCFAVLVDNSPGVLARVVGLFSGRGYNIESLTVDEVNHEKHLSRITIVTRGTPRTIDQIKAQLGRLVSVRKVVNLTEVGPFIEGCLAYIKLIADTEVQKKALLIAEQYRVSVVHAQPRAVIFEMAARADIIDEFIFQITPLGTLEEARTGIVAVGCSDKPLLEDNVSHQSIAR